MSQLSCSWSCLRLARSCFVQHVSRTCATGNIDVSCKRQGCKRSPSSSPLPICQQMLMNMEWLTFMRWIDKILHHLETMVETMVRWYLQGKQPSMVSVVQEFVRPQYSTHHSSKSPTVMNLFAYIRVLAIKRNPIASPSSELHRRGSHYPAS